MFSPEFWFLLLAPNGPELLGNSLQGPPRASGTSQFCFGLCSYVRPGPLPLRLLVTMETRNSTVCFHSTLWSRHNWDDSYKVLKKWGEERIHNRDSLSSMCVFRSCLLRFNLKSISLSSQLFCMLCITLTSFPFCLPQLEGLYFLHLSWQMQVKEKWPVS